MHAARPVGRALASVLTVGTNILDVTRAHVHNDLRGHADRIHLVTGLCTVRHSVRAAVLRCSGAAVLRRDGACETSNGWGVELA